LDERAAKIAIDATARVDEDADGLFAVVFAASLLAMFRDHRFG